MDKLQEFVTTIAARGRITFGDVRLLPRDYLPGGVTTCDEALLLIGLNDVVGRADRAWTQWLLAAVRDFVRGDQPEANTGEPRDRLTALLAAAPSSKTARKVAREINRPVETPA